MRFTTFPIQPLSILESGFFIGKNTSIAGKLRVAVDIGADYIGVGPMFPTITKQDIREVRGPIVIEEIRRAGMEIPIVGIGGINEENVHSVMDAGADGIAVISVISLQENPN